MKWNILIVLLATLVVAPQFVFSGGTKVPPVVKPIEVPDDKCKCPCHKHIR